MKVKKKHVIISITVIFFVLFFAYIFGYVSYKSDTFGNVYINGISIKNTTVSSASSKIKKGINSSSLKLIYKNGNSDTILYKQTGGKIDNDKLAKAIARINEESNKDNSRALWFIKKIQKKEYNVNFVNFDETRLINHLNSIENVKDAISDIPSSQKLIYKNGKWTTSAQKKSSHVNFNKLIDEIETAFQFGKSNVNIKNMITDITEDNTNIEAKKDIANKYCNATIKYRNDISITPQLLVNWIETDSSNTPTMSDEMLKNNVKQFLIENVIKEYSTIGSERAITLSSGKTINVKGGNFGDTVDISKEADKVVKLIKKHSDRSRTPIMTGDETRIKSADNTGIGNTYLEIDLSKNKLNYIKNGKSFLSFDILTGGKDVSNEWTLSNTSSKTPTGVYTIKNKSKDFTVKQLLSDKGKYFYTNKVNYYLSIYPKLCGRKIGICDTTDKDKIETTEETPVSQEVSVYYVIYPDNHETKVDSELQAKQIIKQETDNALNVWIEEQRQQWENSNNSNSSTNLNGSNNNENNSDTNNQQFSISDSDKEAKRKEIESSYRYEARTEIQESTVINKATKEIDKTATYGNIESSTENIKKLFDLVDIGLPVVIHD